MTRDFVSGCALLLFSIVYYLMASAIPVSMLADSVGAQGMPKSYGIALGILSALLILQSLIKRHKASREMISGIDVAAANRKDRRAALRAAGMMGIGIGYVLLLPWLGYLLSLVLLILTTAWYQERARRRWLWLVAVLGAAVFWLIFVRILQIPEPAGIWPSLI
ncbi:MAG: tripartite tricarboxylate transporter TctB family protein [Dongiaceae bacterium]